MVIQNNEKRNQTEPSNTKLLSEQLRLLQAQITEERVPPSSRPPQHHPHRHSRHAAPSEVRLAILGDVLWGVVAAGRALVYK